MMKNFNPHLLFFTLLFILANVFLLPKLSLAQTFDSSSFHIEWGNFNITSGKKTSASYQLTDTVGQNVPGPYSSTGFKLKSGFQYIYDSFYKFSFAISSLEIPLGTLVPSVGSTATNTITISSPSGQGYQIMAAELHPLRITSQSFIPDTSCNSGCTPSSSGVWDLPTAYGFGFNVLGVNSSNTPTGIGTSSYFATENHYRPFADLSSGASSQIIMSENNRAENHQAQVTYKALISATQAAGNYQTGIIFTAVPKY